MRGDIFALMLAGNLAQGCDEKLEGRQPLLAVNNLELWRNANLTGLANGGEDQCAHVVLELAVALQNLNRFCFNVLPERDKLEVVPLVFPLV